MTTAINQPYTKAADRSATQKPLRILLLIDSFQMGGAERITAALLPYLDRQRVAPLICTLRTRGDSPLAAQLGDVRRIDLGARRMIDIAAFKRLLNVLQEEHIDLIHAQLQDATVYAAAASKLTGIPVVVTRHLIGDDMRHSRQKVRNHVERLLIRTGVDTVITVSDAARDYYAQLAHMPHSRFRTIYNGIDLDKFGPAKDKQAERAALGLPTSGPLVTMVGVMRPGKGHEVAIEAARRVPEIQFVLVGDGDAPFRAQLEAQANGLKNVHFLGQRMDIPRILSASDMLILPSDSEALPTVLIEGAASALPVIATRVGGVPEVVVDGETGLLIPPRDPEALANCIRHLLKHDELAKRMGQRAYEKVHERFSLTKQTGELADLYEQVVGKYAA